MSSDPAFLFYPGDYLGGTMGFTLEMHGAYLMLLIYQFNNDQFTEEKALGIVGHIFHDIKRKFVFENGFFYNARLKEEIEKRRKYSESRRQNVAKRYEKSTCVEHMNNTCTTYDLHMENENRNENKNEVLIEFKDKKIKSKADLIYEAYPRKVGKGVAIKKIEMALRKIKYEELIAKVTSYAESVKNRDLQYVPHPATWFGQERYLDPIEQSQQQTKIGRQVFEYERDVSDKYSNL